MGKLRDLAIDAAFWAYNLAAPRAPARLRLPADPYSALHSYFDAIWVLTIRRNEERQRAFRAQYAGLKFEFFYGVDGISLTRDDRRVDLEKARQVNHRNVRANELACTLSHVLMSQAIVDKGLERVLIFEDDAVFLRKNGPWIAYCLERLPADWELFYLGYREGEFRGFGRELQEFLGRRRDPREVVSRSICRGIRTAAGHDYTHAYGVTRSGARKLLEDAFPVVYTADGWLESKILKGELRGYVSVPKIFIQKSSVKSSIHSPRPPA